MIFNRNLPKYVVNTIFLKNIVKIAELWGPSSDPFRPPADEAFFPIDLHIKNSTYW